MNRGVYSAANGMLSIQRALDVSANNLANASTIGYKQDGLSFQDYYVRELQAGGVRIGSLGSGSAVQSDYTFEGQGRLAPTGNPLDLAIVQEGAMFAIQTPGGRQFTRDGQFQIDNINRLVDRSGNLVLDDRGDPITLDGKETITITRDGVINQNDRQVATLGLWSGTFTKVGSNQFESPNAAPTTGFTIEQGSLEQSNVEPIRAMVDMVRFGRAFEMSQKSIQTQDEMTSKVIEVLR